MKETQKNKMVVPKLRFKEFTEDWENLKLDELLFFKNGVNASKEDYGSGYKFINVLDIIENDFITHDKIIGEVNISEKEFEKNIVEYGDILFQRSSETREEVGQSNVYLDKNTPATFGGFVIRGKKKKEYEPRFMNFLLKTSNARKEITSKSGGSTRYNVGQEILSSVEIFIPKEVEQQKIANFLSSVDTKLNLLQQKKDRLEQYKKGVMQQIFSQQLRFKDDEGKEFPKWQMSKLGELFDNVGGTSLEKFFAIDGLYKVVSIGNYNTNGTYKDNGQRIVLNKKTETKLLNKDDLVMVLNDKTKTGDIIGSTILIPTNAEYIYNQRSERLIIKNNNLIPKYAWIFLNSNQFRKSVFMVSQGGTQIYVNFSEVKRLSFPLPSLEEQTKIATFLSAIDNKIALVATQIENTQHFKKGLLQQMFV